MRLERRNAAAGAVVVPLVDEKRDDMTPAPRRDAGSPPTSDTTDDDVVIDLRDSVVAAGHGGFGVRGQLLTDTRQDPRMSGRPDDLEPGHRLEVDVHGPLRDAAEEFVYDVYLRIGYCEAAADRRVRELAPWAAESHIHAVVDEDEEIVGTIRSIYGNYQDLPVGQFDRFDHEMGDPVCELSSLVVRTKHRGTGVIEHLYRIGWLDAFRHRGSALVALIDPWLFDAFRDLYGLPFREIGPAKRYMGTDPVPVGMPLVGDAYLQTARSNPRFWVWILEGVAPLEVREWGLPIVLPTEEDIAASAGSAHAAGHQL